MKEAVGHITEEEVIITFKHCSTIGYVQGRHFNILLEGVRGLPCV